MTHRLEAKMDQLLNECEHKWEYPINQLGRHCPKCGTSQTGIDAAIAVNKDDDNDTEEDQDNLLRVVSENSKK